MIRTRRSCYLSCILESDTEEEDEDNKDLKILAEPGNSLLFVYQSKWQGRLLQKYGNELPFLDAAYKTTCYALTLFFLVVKTNVDYQIVGTFVYEWESTENITEALNAIKDWNPGWKPLYFMTDYSDEEITSIETLFPGNSIYKYRELKETYKLVKISSEKNTSRFACKKSCFVSRLRRWLRQDVLSENL